MMAVMVRLFGVAVVVLSMVACGSSVGREDDTPRLSAEQVAAEARASRADHRELFGCLRASDWSYEGDGLWACRDVLFDEDNARFLGGR